MASDPTQPCVRLLHGDCLEVLRGLPDASVHMCCTSPPYYALRDYQTGKWEGGNDPACEHKVRLKHAVGGGGRGGRTDSQGHAQEGYRDVCGRCGAKRVDSQVGLEATPDLYVARLVAVFREVRRVLRDDGTLWLNIGDSYAGGAGGRGDIGNVIAGTPTRARPVGEGRIKTSAVPNLADSVNHLLKGACVLFFDSLAVAVPAHRVDVPCDDQRTPQSVLSGLLGAQGEGVEQGDDDLPEILDLLAIPRDRRAGVRGGDVGLVVRDDAAADVVTQVADGCPVVLADLDANMKAEFAVLRAGGARSRHGHDAPLAVKEPGEPRAEPLIRRHATWQSFALAAAGKGVPDIDLVNQPVALRDGLLPFACLLRDFRVTQASEEKITFSSVGGRFTLAVADVGHLRFTFGDGSVVPYSQLFAQATRRFNANRPKQELGIPDMVKRALMEDGWICRSTIIWHKPAPMPESVRDRPTRAHEHLFLLTKSPRYFYDAEAIKEDYADERRGDPGELKPRPEKATGPNARNGHSQWETGRTYSDNGGRNRRTVWTVTSTPYPGAHFAVMPEALVEPCVLAGTSARGCCPHCLAPWRRVTQRTRKPTRPGVNTKTEGAGALEMGNRDPQRHSTTTQTTGWAKACGCPDAPPVPAVVLDPFAGSGTVCAVALRHDRSAVGIDLNADYLALARERCEAVTGGLFANPIPPAPPDGPSLFDAPDADSEGGEQQ